MNKQNRDVAKIKNNEYIKLDEIPILGYEEFLALNSSLLKEEFRHLSNFFAIPSGKFLRIFSLILDDDNGDILCLSTLIDKNKNYPSITAIHPAFHPFERDIFETYGINYTDHPWLKPLRYPHYSQKKHAIEEYPFLYYESEDLHEVGVGPIHAGVIEPGHFRFICNGEKILHLEIHLGYQHRGVETLMINKKKLIEKIILAESIAGDTTIGHGTAFAMLYETLCKFTPFRHLSFARTLALELERIAIHTGDLSALSGDVAYQLGNAVFGRLRTPIINFTQSWGGNRLGRGLIRPGKINHPFTDNLARELLNIINHYEKDFAEMCNTLFLRPSVQARFERTGIVKKNDAIAMGLVGMPARCCSLKRDIRISHPHSYYNEEKINAFILNSGDVYARAFIRYKEVLESLSLIKRLINKIPQPEKNEELANRKLLSNCMAVSLVEGWRGEICHVAITDKSGNISHYKIKDPSLHNWFALAMAVRNNEISDFPLCNKSFNLSYCGHDL